MKTFLSDYAWQEWLYGLIAAVVGGGSQAVVGAVGLNIKDPEHFNMKTGGLVGICWTLFASGALVSFFLYLKQSPTPKVKREESTRTTLLPSGAVSVTQKLTTTPVEAPPKEEK